MTLRILFVGDVVGEIGVAYVERHLPTLIARHLVDVTVVNGENVAASDTRSGAGITPESAHRLFAAGADAITGGNHSWDAPDAIAALALPRVLRPHNLGALTPGTGTCIVTKDRQRIGIVNLASRSAIAAADHPYDAMHTILDGWRDAVDTVIVDFHGDTVSEKLTFAYAFDGHVAAIVGTHTHVPTLDTRILPRGTAYVTDVGMTGPADSLQGYGPDRFVAAYRTRLPKTAPARVATGPIALGAVLIDVMGGRAGGIERVDTE
jgi:metallophosphoesterase (TIGR00282 family)